MKKIIEKEATIVIVKAIFFTILFILLSVFFCDLWTSLLSPMQSTLAADQLSDSNSTYAMSRALSTFSPWSVFGPFLVISILILWGRTILLLRSN